MRWLKFSSSSARRNFAACDVNHRMSLFLTFTDKRLLFLQIVSVLLQYIALAIFAM